MRGWLSVCPTHTRKLINIRVFKWSLLLVPKIINYLHLDGIDIISILQ